MADVYEKMIDEAMAAQMADVSTVKRKRGQAFVIGDARAYLDAVEGMEPGDLQSKEVFRLHTDSVKAHFKTLEGLTKTIRPEDDPFVEHYQTPVVMEILREEDPAFDKSVEAFVVAIGRAEALIGRESIRRYAGMYGPTCVVDFALIPGSTSNVVNQILKTTDISKPHQQAILAAKSWAMLTSYGIGETFASEIEKGATPADATEKEIEMFQSIYSDPVDAQAVLMDEAGQSSFDHRRYMAGYKKELKAAVREAMDEGVHYGNILTVPAYCVGDIAHHISQSSFNMCKDDVVMGVIEAVTGVMDRTLRNGLGSYRNEYDILSLATSASAAATEYILELDGFNAIMVTDMLTKRFHNYVQLYPTRGGAAELHNCDFMDMIYHGWRIVDKARRMQDGTGNPLKPVSAGFAIDLSPIHENEVLMNPQRYAYPACAITVRYSALMRLADYPCLLTSEPVTATLMTNIIALHPDKPASPARICKNCASAALIDFRHQYCQWKEAV